MYIRLFIVGQESSHRLLQLLKVLLLISQLLLQLHELLFFALLDGVVLVGLLALLKGVSVQVIVRQLALQKTYGAWERTLGPRSLEELQYRRRP